MVLNPLQVQEYISIYRNSWVFYDRNYILKRNCIVCGVEFIAGRRAHYCTIHKPKPICIVRPHKKPRRIFCLEGLHYFYKRGRGQPKYCNDHYVDVLERLMHKDAENQQKKRWVEKVYKTLIMGGI